MNTSRLVKSAIKKIGSYIDQRIGIPQDYSFFIFGSHGSGLHSMMYYISLLNNGSVYPASMFVLRNDIDRWRDMISFRFYSRIFKNIKKNTNISKWGLTFDGGPTNQQWILRNITKIVPSIFLVRDPILAIVSHMNYRMFADIYLRKTDYDIQYYYDMIVKNPLELNMTCGFYTNMRKVENHVGNRMYLDTQDLIGDRAKVTMRRVADFLGVGYMDRQEFGMGINTPFTRYFPMELVENGVTFRVSPFCDMFQHCWYPKYCEKNMWKKIAEMDFREKLFIFSNTNQKITDNMMQKIKTQVSVFVENLEEKITKYEYKKIKVEDLYQCINDDQEHRNKIRDFLAYEASDIKKNDPKIYENWKDLHIFLA